MVTVSFSNWWQKVAGSYQSCAHLTVISIVQLMFDCLFGPFSITFIIIKEWTSNRFDTHFTFVMNITGRTRPHSTRSGYRYPQGWFNKFFITFAKICCCSFVRSRAPVCQLVVNSTGHNGENSMLMTSLMQLPQSCITIPLLFLFHYNVPKI